MDETGLAGITAEILLIARFGIAGLFIRAGTAKLTDLGEFRLAITNYEILPAAVVPVAAMSVPAGEAAGGILLLLGVIPGIVSAVLAVLMVCFSAAIGFNLARGRVFDCGCGGSTAPRLISWRHVAVNIALAVLAVGIAIAPPGGLELLPGPRGLLSVEIPTGSATPALLAAVLCVMTLRLLTAALAVRSG